VPEMARLGVRVPLLLVGCKSDLRAPQQSLHQVWPGPPLLPACPSALSYWLHACACAPVVVIEVKCCSDLLCAGSAAWGAGCSCCQRGDEAASMQGP
jgi:hypothetical protein